MQLFAALLLCHERYTFVILAVLRAFEIYVIYTNPTSVGWILFDAVAVPLTFYIMVTASWDRSKSQIPDRNILTKLFTGFFCLGFLNVAMKLLVWYFGDKNIASYNGIYFCYLLYYVGEATILLYLLKDIKRRAEA